MPKFGNRPSTSTGSNIKGRAPSISRSLRPDHATGSVIRKAAPAVERLKGKIFPRSDIKK